MMRPTPLRRLVAAAALGVAAVAAAAPTSGATPTEACGLTTLDATVVPDPANPGTLKCAQGQPAIPRDDLKAGADTSRASHRDALVSFAAFTDLHAVDSESPLRAEFLRKCEIPKTGTSSVDQSDRSPARSAFRWQETMATKLINAQIQTANAIDATEGGPVTHRPFDFAVQLGDLTDNQQWNELRWGIDLLDGGQVSTDSGAPGYEGVQGRDPQTGTPLLTSPQAATSMRDLAIAPFQAMGLRQPNGSQLPWYSVIGNHDVKVQGTVPNTDGWQTFANALATGTLKITDLPPDEQERVCADPTLLGQPAFWQEIAAAGSTKVIKDDSRRRLVDRNQWIAEHLQATAAKQLDTNAVGSPGLPAGHGFAPDTRCKDANGNPLERACYSFDQPGDATLPKPVPLHFIALDTAAAEGTDDGNLDQPEWDWLQRDLIAHSATYYDESGAKVTNAGGKDALIVILSHHTESTMTNAASTDKRYSGTDLEALLHRFPNVVLQLDGHTHYNKVWAHPDPNGKTSGYWEINTSSLIDWPHESRTIEIADNHDGTVSIFAVNFGPAVPPNPRWIQPADDPNHLAWLASAAREVGYNDPQLGAASPWSDDVGADAPGDRNVELLVKNPFGVTPARRPAPPGSPPTGGTYYHPPFSLLGYRLLRRPSFPFPFPYPYTPPTSTPGQYPGYYARTGPGIGVPAKPAGHSVPAQPSLLLLTSVLGAAWLYRARIRSWMLGS